MLPDPKVPDCITQEGAWTTTSMVLEPGLHQRLAGGVVHLTKDHPKSS